jgi:hypothetical protein
MLTAVMLLEVLPYFEEFLRSWRVRKAVQDRRILAMEPADSFAVIPPIEKDKASWRKINRGAQARK